MSDDWDIGDLNLLEWSQDLNRALLGLPFRLLRSIDQESACFLYKLVFSSSRKEAGLLLLDCDACNASYEGVSLRTLDRRTQVFSKAASRSDDAAHLGDIIAAIHHALDPRTAFDSSLKTTIGLESTRFSSSLSISVKSKRDDDVVDCGLKTSFDLDPLDHASSANMISAHFIRPLLHLADVFARCASQQQLDRIHQQPVSGSSPAASSDSLELLRRSALVNAKLAVGPLHPLSPRNQDGNKGDNGTDGNNDNTGNDMISSVTTIAALRSAATSDLDDDADMLFFGPPPGLKPPLRQSRTARIASSQVMQGKSLSSPSRTLSAGSEDGDRTLTAPLGSAAAASTCANPAHASPSSVPRRNASTLNTQEGSDSDPDSDSDTSEEDSLPFLTSTPSKEDSRTNQTLSSPVPAVEHIQTRASRASHRTAPKTPEPTLPPPSFVPTSSQISPSSSNAARDEQKRRREHIASIKRGNADPSLRSTSTNSPNKAAKPVVSTRKRARF
ncbi:hypothetical protein EX895_001078 [Sporisorium graminicola]|uniref:Uncharacterized protein n=1 Tax=Sporisorium graminicola TaxID=280036 RepID=A0A4U7KY71_9BASI|nr:hypothetical protein EX895_001078 [Sporisorium graminicola]TKY89781.1 hypothetical protein EX895_001078 [Sporisorium graminicola]